MGKFPGGGEQLMQLALNWAVWGKLRANRPAFRVIFLAKETDVKANNKARGLKERRVSMLNLS